MIRSHAEFRDTHLREKNNNFITLWAHTSVVMGNHTLWTEPKVVVNIIIKKIIFTVNFILKIFSYKIYKFCYEKHLQKIIVNFLKKYFI